MRRKNTKNFSLSKKQNFEEITDVYGIRQEVAAQYREQNGRNVSNAVFFKLFLNGGIKEGIVGLASLLFILLLNVSISSSIKEISSIIVSNSFLSLYVIFIGLEFCGFTTTFFSSFCFSSSFCLLAKSV